LSLRRELSNLFGESTTTLAKQLTPGRIDALAVEEAAGALLRLKGKPTEQVALVRAMKPETAAALCRWLADPAFWGLVSGITKH
jgi:hypothetical protein